MAKKAIGLDVAKVAKKALSADNEDVFSVMVLAGVAKKIRLKHTSIGSGVVLGGDFAGETWTDQGQELTIESASLLLPMEIGNKIAKHMNGTKNQVKFKVVIGAKKSSVLAQGFGWVLSWEVEPQEVGQIDLVREMMKG